MLGGEEVIRKEGSPPSLHQTSPEQSCGGYLCAILCARKSNVAVVGFWSAPTDNTSDAVLPQFAIMSLVLRDKADKMTPLCPSSQVSGAGL